MTDDAPITPITDEAIAAAAEAAAAPEAPAPAPEPEPAPAPAPAPQNSAVGWVTAPTMSDVDALGLEIIGLKQRLDLAERRAAFLSELFAWPDGLK